MTEDDGTGAGALAYGFDGDADLTQDAPEADGGAEVVGGDGEADPLGEERRGEAGEPVLVQRLPVAAVQEDRDGRGISGGEQVHDLARSAAIGELDRRMGGARGLGGLAPALHDGGMVGHAGAVIVFRFVVDLAALTRHAIIR